MRVGTFVVVVVPDFRGKTSNLSLLSMKLTVGLLYMAFIMLSYIPSIPNLLSVFIIKGCCISSNAFSLSIEMITIFIFHAINVAYHVIDLYILKHPCNPGINVTWSWYIILFMCY